MKIFDITLPITNDLPGWPGDTPIDIQQTSRIGDGENANVSKIQFSVHTGTHIDAPLHFIESGISIDKIPVSKLIGQVYVIEIEESINLITAEVLKKHPTRQKWERSKKILFKTRNSSFWKHSSNEFLTDYVGVDTSASEFLAGFNFDLIGIDYLSIAAYQDILKPHQILLRREIVLLEGVNLENISQGFYEIYCLPLLIHDSDGAPARVILVQL